MTSLDKDGHLATADKDAPSANAETETTSPSGQSPSAKKPRRKWIYVCLVAAFLLSAAIVVARVRFNGKPLAQFVEGKLEGNIRGQVKVGSITWPLGGLLALVGDGWVEVEVHDLEVYDEFEDLVIKTRGATLEIDVHAAITGDYRLRNVKLSHGGYAYLKSVKEPYPAHEYDTTVISLLSAFYPEKSPGFSTGYSAAARATVEVENFLVEGGGGLRVEMDQGDTKVVIEGITGSGYLYHGGADPLGPKLYYSLAPVSGIPTRADAVTITYKTINEVGETTYQLPIALHDIEVLQLSQLPSRWPAELVPRDIQYKITAKGEDGMELDLEGAMLDSWIDVFGGELKLALDVRHAGKIAHDASDGLAGGDDLSLSLRMSGPLLAPKGRAEIENLEVYIPMGEGRERLELQIDRAVPSWDTATDTGSMTDVVAHVKGGAGSLELEALFRVDPLHFDLNIDIPDPIELAPYLPEELLAVAGGSKLSGRLVAHGNEVLQRLEELELTLGEAKVSGLAYREGTRITAESPGVTVNLPGLALNKVHGSLDPSENEIDLVFDLALTRAQRYLRLFDIKLPLDGLGGRVTVRGQMDDPVVTAPALVAKGLPVIDKLRMGLQYAGRQLVVRNAFTATMGGTVEASGSVNLAGRVPQLRDIKATAVKLDLSKFPVVGAFLAGTLSVQLTGEGSVKRPELQLNGQLSNWSLAGEAYADTSIVFASRRNGDMRVEGSLAREAGGVLHLEALVGRSENISGIFSLRDLPLDSLLAHWSGLATTAGGALSTEVQLSGTTKAPMVTGQVTLLRSWVRNAFLGTTELAIEPAGDSQIRITGDVLQGRLSLDWLLTTKAPYASEISLRIRRFEVDRFLPELSAEHNVRGWLTGQINIQGDLLGTTKPTMQASLSEAEIVLANEDEDGRPSPVRLRNKTPLVLNFDGDVLRFAKEAIISGPTGDFTLSGDATESALNFAMEGTVAVKTLEPYVGRQFDTMDGKIHAGIKLVGTLESPKVVGILDLRDIYLKLAGQDAIITIPNGKIDFSNSQLSLTGLRIIVSDQFSDESSELHVSGGLALDNFAPDFWAMRIEGQLAGKMLLAAAPEVFSAASGSASISVALLGSGSTPDIDGTIEFNGRNTLSLTPRAVHREIALTTGVLRFTDQLIEFEGIEGTVDGEGQITELKGNISLDEWAPVDVDISVSTRDLLFRIPQTLELAVHLNGFEVVGDAEGLEIAGRIEVADGRYIQRFNPVLDALQPTRATAGEPSIFESVPLLGNARLKLALVSRAFYVDNNVANIELNGELGISGTPLNPRIDGVINVAQGNFKFQGIRARFTQTKGSVSFSPALQFPYQTPYIDIQSEGEFASSDGQNHLIQLGLRGPISKLEFDLGTSAGLTKQQTMQLLLVGRTPEDVRRSLLGDEAVSGRPGEFTNQSTSGSDNSLDVLDQFTKDIAGDYFSTIIGDRLRQVTKLDVARLQVGTASFGFYGEKVLTRSWKFVGQIERSLNGWNWDLRTDYRFDDQISFGGNILKTYFNEEADDDITRGSIRATLRDYWIP